MINKIKFFPAFLLQTKLELNFFNLKNDRILLPTVY